MGILWITWPRGKRWLDQVTLGSGRLLGCLLLLGVACTRKVPDTIDRAFTSKFLNARDIEWHYSPDGHWLVNFYMEKFDYMTASYTLDGLLEYFELELHGEEVPKQLMDRVKKAYPESTLFDVYERNRGNSAEYIFEIVDHGSLFGIDFFEDGHRQIIPSNDYRFTSRILVGD
ncbi:MAG: hypothetical protein CMH47_04390 [Muricauda sp.]|nr:hypothetical protein [uncultured Allomuricauda sp.]MBC71520.1 hypothetical protein [Allomuricauda sp.]|tara:strand:+ start:3682 stop:4200 length:519 start_codon:yes stop_codon:yes gene_type:complete